MPSRRLATENDFEHESFVGHPWSPFRGVHPDTIRTMLDMKPYWATFEADETVLTQKEPASYQPMRFIASGRLRIYHVYGKDPHDVGEIGPGEISGGVGAFWCHDEGMADEGRGLEWSQNMATVVARERTQVLEVGPGHAVAAINDPIFLRNLLRSVLRKMLERGRYADRQRNDERATKIRRLFKEAVEAAVRSGHLSLHKGFYYGRLLTGHGDIAQRLACERSVVSRCVSEIPGVRRLDPDEVVGLVDELPFLEEGDRRRPVYRVSPSFLQRD